LADHPLKFLQPNKRQLVDQITRVVVSLGGVVVIATIVLIFLYLFRMVAPIFATATIQPDHPIATVNRDVRLLDFNDNSEVILRFSEAGLVEFFTKATGLPLAAYDLGVRVAKAIEIENAPGLYAVLDTESKLWFVQSRYNTNFVEGQRKISARLQLPFSRRPIQMPAIDLMDAQQRNDEIRVVTAKDSVIQVLNLRISELSAADATPIDPTPAALSHTHRITWVFSGPRNELIYAVDEQDNLLVFNPSIQDQPLLTTSLNPASGNVLSQTIPKITALTTLAGRNAIVAASDDGDLRQWLFLNQGAEPQVIAVRAFKNNSPVLRLLAEPRRKGFVAIDNTGLISLYHPANFEPVAYFEGGFEPTRAYALSNSSDWLISQNASGLLEPYQLDNPHPEISLSSLLQKYWYEGYSQPIYSWQSTSADDNSEPKFSLVPLFFGTVKATFYALLFAVPLAVFAAIYTGYFMSPKLRALVKPSIETLAALPTVILGFIGGIWLAPYIEENLATFFTMVTFIPLSIGAAAMFSLMLPNDKRPRSEHLAFWAVPVFVLAIASAIALGPWLETILFGGDSQAWLRDSLGLEYAQRNALIVGIIMGMAIIPIIYTISEDAIHEVPKHLVAGSLALGATSWQTLTRVVLLTAGSGIASAIMIGSGRAIGETMIVLMVTGNTPLMDFNIFEGMRTFAANIATEMSESEVGSTHFRILFLTAFALFVLTFSLNTGAELVRQKLRSRYSEL
tara:strand:- start:2405 stop:4615 length:2211 start_codon:yes stop_codon:yes gene_type:complete